MSRYLAMALAAGCAPGNVEPTSTSVTAVPMTDPTMPPPTTDPTDATGTSGTVEPTTGDVGDPVGSREVDILFVIDNSGSMGQVQQQIAKSIAAFVDVLEAPEAALDYRIAITTSDNGNPRCPDVATTPESGKFVRSSCIGRVAEGEFMYLGQDYSAACTSYCSRSDDELEVLPTTTTLDGQAAPRMWVERTGGQLNIVGASATEALQCYLPQGVTGCGFESQLESMYLALVRSNDQLAPTNYGFLRDTAQLVVVIVSDETDCSGNPAAKEIFTTNKVFWNSPDDPAPTSSLCWHAGVACSGSSPYSECHAENFALTGQPGASDAGAALLPTRKYVDYVKMIEKARQNFDPNLRVKVSLITGVPVGYDGLSAELVYADAADPDYQEIFGIGPGCVVGDPQAPDAAAVPPVREREFAEAFTLEPAAHRNLYSICAKDYAGALTAIATEIVDAL